MTEETLWKEALTDTWFRPKAPSTGTEVSCTSGRANVLCVSYCPTTKWIMFSTADKALQFVSCDKPYDLAYDDGANLGCASPFLSICDLRGGVYLLTAMDGSLVVARHARRGRNRALYSRRWHAKYAVQVIAHSLGATGDGAEQSFVVATAGWDQKVNVFLLRWKSGAEEDAELETWGDENLQLIDEIALPSNPSSLVFARHPDTKVLHLIISRRDSTFLSYHAVAHEPGATASWSAAAELSSSPLKVTASGRQNLAPHSTAWTSFTPSHLALSPVDPTLLAVATSHTPHMKLILVRLLFPPAAAEAEAEAAAVGDDVVDTSTTTASQTPLTIRPGHATHTSQARAALRTQDREEAALLLVVSAFAPQTPYSTPQVVWRPGGSGVWVNGDDGVVRGLEVGTGRVVALLGGGGGGNEGREGHGGHEGGVKVRCLWAGFVGGPERGDEGGGREVVISGGFDRRVFVWEVAGGGGG